MDSSAYQRSLLLAATIFLLVAASAFLLSLPHQVAHAQQGDMVARGQYLAMTTCVDCHTPRVAGDPYHLDRAKLFAGGEDFEGPWGKVFARNITSDRETGIGAWTEDEIKRAIRDGIAKDGTKLLVMPWEIFRGLSDADITAIAAYLKTVPAVKHQVPDAQLAPPQAVEGFVKSIPPLAAAVPPELYSKPRDLFHDFFFPGPANPSASKPAAPGFMAPTGKDSPVVGQYLAQNMLGCTFCHAPNLAGGTPPFFAPNITVDEETGIGLWTKEDIVRALREGLRPTGLQRRDPSRPSRDDIQPGLRRLSPVMPAGDLAFGRLSDDDVYNVIAFIQSMPAVRRALDQPNPAFPGPPPPPRPAPPATAPPPAPEAPAALPKTGGPATGAWMALLAALGATLGLGGLALRRSRS